MGSLVRILVNTPRGMTFGSGTLVSPQTILTARHVVDPFESSLAGTAIDLATIGVESREYMGQRRPARVSFPPDGKVDLALIHLADAHRLDVDLCCPIRAHPERDFSVGDEAAVGGFSLQVGDAESDKVRIMQSHPATASWICNRALPQGYSGGPVVVEEGLVGVLYARNSQQQQAYFYGHGHIRSLLEDCQVSPIVRDVVISPLRQYPLGPAVPRMEVLSELHAVIAAYIELYQDVFLVAGTVARAVDMRQKCGPVAGAEGILNMGYLPNPLASVAAFWTEAFQAAGLKSPRMLAALLLVAPDDALNGPARDARIAFLEKLRNWRR
jgi:hypothetical protein